MSGLADRTATLPITVVSGMHRSGTSLITGCLVEGGWFAGADTDLVPADANNPSGYFEHGRLNQATDAILAALDADWATSPAPADVASRGAGHADDLADVVRGLLAGADGRPLVVKEPRLSTLWPLWPDHLRDTAHVLPLRHPLSVARSLVTRDGLPIPVGLALWEHQLRSVLQWLSGRRVLVVRYEDVVAGRATAWTGLEEFVDAVGLACAVDPDAVRAAGIVRADLDRHPAGAADESDLARLDDGQRLLLDWLRDLRGHHATLQVPPDLLADRGAALETLVAMRAHRVPADEALTEARRGAAAERRRFAVTRERLSGELAAARTAADAVCAELADLSRTVAERDRTIADLTEALAEQTEALAEQTEAVARTTGAFADQAEALALAEADAARARADAHRAGAETDRLGTELDTLLDEAEALRADLRGSEAALVVAEAARHHLGVQLCAVLQRLDAIEASRSHRLVVRAARLWRRCARPLRLRLRRSERPIPRRAAA